MMGGININWDANSAQRFFLVCELEQICELEEQAKPEKRRVWADSFIRNQKKVGKVGKEEEEKEKEKEKEKVKEGKRLRKKEK